MSDLLTLDRLNEHEMIHQDNHRKTLFVWLIYSVCFFYGFFIFASGLLPYGSQARKISSVADKPVEPFTEITSQYVYRHHFNKLVFVLIDGLRSDFVQPTPRTRLYFPRNSFVYVDELIKQGKALFFDMKAYSPTVTLPRIKTLISGTLPGFFDVLSNFDAKQMVYDNWLSQAADSNRSVVFYGDDTWIRLLPNIFRRYGGTHSFYVSDYEEVDNNVTRHLKAEFLIKDWDIMVLHYLGIDHLGHANGPSSPIMPRKLEEMDGIVHYINENLNGNNNLIVICGDHGMTANGNHGGNTDHEIWTPLIFINDKEHEALINNISNSISQVDVAITISVLLGLPIPANSLGVIIPEVLHFSGFTQRQVLYAAFYNMHHFSNLYKTVFNESENELLQQDSVQEIVSRHHHFLKLYLSNSTVINNMDYLYLLNMYMKKLFEIKNLLIENSVGYNTYSMVMGLVLTHVSLLSSFSMFFHSLLFSGLISLKSCVCRVSPFILFFIIKSVVPVWVISIEVIFTMVGISVIYSQGWSVEILRNFNISEAKLLTFFLIISVASFTSSSFIEEEHQVWYFICTTISLIFMKSIILSLLLSWIKKNPWSLNQNSQDNKLRDRQKFHKLTKQHFFPPNDSPRAVILLAVFLILSRLLRSWNQTGNKWSHLPDIHDSLFDLQHTVWYHCLIVVSQLIVFIFLSKDLITVSSCVSKDSNFISCLLMFSAFTWIYITKCHSPLLKNIAKHLSVNSEVVFGSRIVYIHVIFIFVLAVLKHVMFSSYKYFKSYANDTANFLLHLIESWVVLVMCLMPAENIPVVAGILVQEHIINRMTWQKFTLPVFNMFVYLIMAMCSYFYMGNSNSLSTIDVSAGYTGLTSYYPWLTGLLILCNTYSSLTIWVLFGFYRMYCVYRVNLYDDQAKNNFMHQVVCCGLSLMLFRMVVLTFYLNIVYIQRYHLFVMSVFLPKLFYEIAHTFMFTIVTYFILLFCL